MALVVKRAVTKSQWDAKVDSSKSLGYPKDEILLAFKRRSNYILRSPDKLDAWCFWMEQLGWDPLVILEAPTFSDLVFRIGNSKGLCCRISSF